MLQLDTNIEGHNNDHTYRSIDLPINMEMLL